MVQQHGGSGRTAEEHPQIARDHTSPRIQRAIVTHRSSAGGLPGIARDQTSRLGQIMETVVEGDYCAKYGCALMVSEWFDNPVVSSHIAFLSFNNHLTPAQIAWLAVLSQISLNRPNM